MAIEERNLYMDIVDDVLDEEKFNSGAEGFRVKDDITADWCLDVIREAKAEIKRFEMVVNEKVKTLNDRLESFKGKQERKISYFEGLLREYIESLSIKPTKAGNKIYNLPSGKLQLKKQEPEYIKDETKLLQALKKAGMKDYIKTVEKPEWEELKKVVTVSGKVIVNENGEIIDGVEVRAREPKFEVKV